MSETWRFTIISANIIITSISLLQFSFKETPCSLLNVKYRDTKIPDQNTTYLSTTTCLWINRWYLKRKIKLINLIKKTKELFTIEWPFICSVGVFDSKVVDTSSVCVIIMLLA